MRFNLPKTRKPLTGNAAALAMIHELTAHKPGDPAPVFTPGVIHAPGKPTLCGQGGEVSFTNETPVDCPACSEILMDPKAALRKALQAHVGRTLWPDRMILETVRDGGMLTEQAMARARELAAQGLIDTSGTWRLTAAGKRFVRKDKSV